MENQSIMPETDFKQKKIVFFSCNRWRCHYKILFKVFSSMKIFNFLQGLVGFGNLRFAKIKSCPSASI